MVVLNNFCNNFNDLNDWSLKKTPRSLLSLSTMGLSAHFHLDSWSLLRDSLARGQLFSLSLAGARCSGGQAPDANPPRLGRKLKSGTGGGDPAHKVGAEDLTQTICKNLDPLGDFA